MSATATATTAPAPAATATPRRRNDHYIWGTYIFLVIVSLIELYSASSQEVTAANIYGPIVRHGFCLLLGLGCMLGLQRLHYRHIYYSIPIYVVLSIAAMILVLMVGVKINGARRGLNMGILILPAEFIKLGAALGVAWLLSRHQMKKANDVDNRGVAWCVVLIAFCGGLLFGQGLTNTVLLMCISLSMMLIGGVSYKKMGIVVAIYAVLGGGAYLIKRSGNNEVVTERAVEIARLNHEEVKAGTGNRSDTWKGRIARHFIGDKHLEPITSINKQEQFSYIAQAHGGLTGVGPGNSRENARLPLAFSDYIYAIIVEEGGLAAGLAVLAMYLVLLIRAARIAMRFKQTFPCLLVIGCAVYIVYQALFHMAIVSGFFPVSGQPLPLISKGGTSIIVTSLALGIMLSVSRFAADKNDKEAVKAELQMLPEDIHSDNPIS